MRQTADEMRAAADQARAAGEAAATQQDDGARIYAEGVEDALRWALGMIGGTALPDELQDILRIPTSCNCDLDSPCSFPPCVAERDAEEAAAFAAYRGTSGPSGMTYAEQMVDAGRGHLLRADEL